MAVNTDQVSVHAYGSGNVTTSAYTTLIAATAVSCGRIAISDTSTKLLKLAIGDADSEIDICQCPVSGIVVIPVYIPAGSRISIKAIDATATTGYNVVSLLA
jgi:hypothetical protein